MDQSALSLNDGVPKRWGIDPIRIKQSVCYSLDHHQAVGFFTYSD